MMKKKPTSQRLTPHNWAIILLISLALPSCSKEEIETNKTRSKNYAKSKEQLPAETSLQDTPLSVASGLNLRSIAFDPSLLGEITEAQIDYADLSNQAPGIKIRVTASSYGLPFEYKICAEDQPELCFPSEQDQRSFYGPSGISYYHLSGIPLRVSVRQCIRAYQTETNSKKCTEWLPHVGEPLFYPDLESVPDLADSLAQAEASKGSLRSACIAAVSSVARFVNQHNAAISDPNLFALLSNSILAGEDNCTYSFLGGLDLALEDRYEATLAELSSFGVHSLDIADAFNLLSLMSGLALHPSLLLAFSEPADSIQLTYSKGISKLAHIKTFGPNAPTKKLTPISKSDSRSLGPHGIRDGDIIKARDGTEYIYIKSEELRWRSAFDERSLARRATWEKSFSPLYNEGLMSPETASRKAAALTRFENAQSRVKYLEEIGGSDLAHYDLSAGVFARIKKNPDGGPFQKVTIEITDEIPARGTAYQYGEEFLTPEEFDVQVAALRKADAEAYALFQRQQSLFAKEGIDADKLSPEIKDLYTPMDPSNPFAVAHNQRIKDNLDKLDRRFTPTASDSIALQNAGIKDPADFYNIQVREELGLLPPSGSPPAYTRYDPNAAPSGSAAQPLGDADPVTAVIADPKAKAGPPAGNTGTGVQASSAAPTTTRPSTNASTSATNPAASTTQPTTPAQPRADAPDPNVQTNTRGTPANQKVAKEKFKKAKTSKNSSDTALYAVSGIFLVAVGAAAFSYIREETKDTQVDGVGTGTIDSSEETADGAALTLTSDTLDQYEVDLSRMLLELADIYQILQREGDRITANETNAGLALQTALAAIKEENPDTSSEEEQALPTSEFDEFGNPIDNQNPEP